MTKAAVLSAALSLSWQDHIDVAIKLWFMVEQYEIAITDELRAELDRRIEEDEANESPVEPWSVLRENLLRRDF